MVSGRGDHERHLRRDVGTLPLSGRDRSLGRDQLPLAAVRDLQSAARDGRVMRGHHRHHQDGEGTLRADHAAAARVAVRRHDDRGVGKALLRRPAARLHLARAAVAWRRGGGHAPGRSEGGG